MRLDSLLQYIKTSLLDTLYIWGREMRTSVKDEGVLIFCILVPLLYPLIYSWVYNNEVVREVPVAVIDHAHSATSRRFIRSLNAGPNVRVAYHCNTLDEARELTGRQQIYGTIYFPEDFDRRLFRGEQAVVSVYADMSLMLTYKAVYQTVLDVATLMNTRIQVSRSHTYTDNDAKTAVQPLDIRDVPLFNVSGGYGNAVIPGILMLILQQTLLLGIGLSAGTARENNRFQELIPISKHYNGIYRIIFGKALWYFMLYAVMGSYLALVIPHIYGFDSFVTPASLTALLLPYILSCIFFGMMLSCIVRYRENVMLLVVFTSVPFIFLSGLSWPQSNMPGVWQAVAWLIPSTFGVRGFLRISSMGASPGDIQTEVLVLWLQTLVYFLGTYLVYRFQFYITRKRATTHLHHLQDITRSAKAQQRSTPVPPLHA